MIRNIVLSNIIRKKCDNKYKCYNFKYIKKFLSDRKHRVILNEWESKWDSLFAGVPQRSALGPLLFLAYINDLTDNISSNMRLFADDLSLFATVRSIN